MNNGLLLTVIIPFYKGNQYIVETINGLKKIKHSKEILIIDDGSPDDSFSLCKNLWKNDSEIILLEKKNSGIVETRNYGLQYKTGKYVIFVDHDDIVIPNVIDTAINKAEENNCEMVFWSTERYIEQEQKSVSCDTVYRNHLYCNVDPQEVLLREMLMNQNNSSISYIGHVWAVLYQSAYLDQNKIKIKKFVDIEDDYLFVFDSLLYAKRVLTIKETGYLWRYNTKSETYRQKYIADGLNKFRDLYTYIWNETKKVINIDEIDETFKLYATQDVIVKSVENTFTCLCRDRKEIYKLKNLIRSETKVFQENPIIPYEKRRKRVFNLLKAKQIFVCYVYIYLDSLYRYCLRRKK